MPYFIGQSLFFSGIKVTVSEITETEIVTETTPEYAAQTGIIGFVMLHADAACGLYEGGE